MAVRRHSQAGGFGEADRRPEDAVAEPRRRRRRLRRGRPAHRVLLNASVRASTWSVNPLSTAPAFVRSNGRRADRHRLGGRTVRWRYGHSVIEVVEEDLSMCLGTGPVRTRNARDAGKRPQQSTRGARERRYEVREVPRRPSSSRRSRAASASRAAVARRTGGRTSHGAPETVTNRRRRRRNSGAGRGVRVRAGRTRRRTHDAEQEPP